MRRVFDATTGPTTIFDPIFGSEDRGWGCVLRSSGLKNAERRGESSKKGGILRRRGILQRREVLRRTPLLSSFFGAEDQRTPIFDLRSRRSKNPPILNLRSSEPKIEEPPSSIFGPEEWVDDRTEEGRGGWDFFLRRTKKGEGVGLPPSKNDERRGRGWEFFLRRTKKWGWGGTSSSEERRTPHLPPYRPEE